MQPQGQGLLRQVSNSSNPPSTPLPLQPPQSQSRMPLPFPSSLLIKQEDLNQIKSDSASTVNNLDDVPIPPVWSPPGVPPSPKLGKKFRPVNFTGGSASFNGANEASSTVPSSPVVVSITLN